MVKEPFSASHVVSSRHAGDRAGRGMSGATTIDGGECYGGSEE
jgi:hypothetical protein